jgi:hypothetical protein
VSAEDVDAIRALVHEYAFRLDKGNLDGVAELFEHAELGSTVAPVRMRGIAQARKYYTGVIIYDDGTPRTQHAITNVTVTVDGDGTHASSRSYFTVFQAVDGFELRPVIAGSYADRFEKVGGAWRFTERIIDPTLIGDLSRHMTPEWTPR